MTGGKRASGPCLVLFRPQAARHLLDTRTDVQGVDQRTSRVTLMRPWQAPINSPVACRDDGSICRNPCHRQAGPRQGAKGTALQSVPWHAADYTANSVGDKEKFAPSMGQWCW